MPIEVDPPAKITWDSRDDWASVLALFVESGRTDFKPISTTSRGPFAPKNLCNHAPFVLIHDHPAFDSSRTINSLCSRITHHSTPVRVSHARPYPRRRSVHPQHIFKPLMSNIHRISIVHIISSITIHLRLSRRFLGTIRQCHVGLPHLYLFPASIQLVEYKVAPLISLSLSFAFSFIENIWFELSLSTACVLCDTMVSTHPDLVEIENDEKSRLGGAKLGQFH
ncbi:uncharacterized protein LACBIDRAFT_329723 [Laccaria bicolor S238N-H82]|uniref:Predicted protein n=1 Tax=Laccaria bicolor (strain S238N-H82 / ATCC MYA-4686) TaxID=486041 RepID=B0DJ10_LACBS|nr:uncharacterized protein LACBIDRAFT_329723 [Laccaria bicolor S238N-H82]EDR05437.1 predicted protein [Laccaria bicolor S238N-H82]|eukprot:XP_001883995.1 predicted protein [Laccaria bicolor S238N-H82]